MHNIFPLAVNFNLDSCETDNGEPNLDVDAQLQWEECMFEAAREDSNEDDEVSAGNEREANGEHNSGDDVHC